MSSQLAGAVHGCDSDWVAPIGLQAWEPADDVDSGAGDDPAAGWEPADRTAPWRLWVPGGMSRPGGTAGAGFAAGQAADDTPPGAALAALTASAWDQRERVSDDELIGIIRAWRRLSSWVAAGELAAVAELVARREAQVTAGADPHIAEHVDDEIAAALTLTGRAADQLVGFAADLARLPATSAALAAGEIDRARAAVIATGTSCLTAEHAAAVEAAVIGKASGQTTSQLRAAVARAALAADPSAAARRQREALKRARVEAWDEQSGTAALAGRDLPPADVLAADRRIDTLARQLKQAGAAGSMDGLRARVYTALLLGIPLQVLQAQLTGAGAGAGKKGAPPADPAGDGPLTAAAGGAGDAGRLSPDGPLTAAAGGAGDAGRLSPDGPLTGQAAGGLLSRDANVGPDGDGSGITGSLIESLPGAPLAGSVNLTMPLLTWLGGNAPGEADGYWPVPAEDARSLARLLAARPGARICLTLTSPSGRALAHGCTSVRRNGRPGSAPELTFSVKPFSDDGACIHEHESPAYRPPDLLRHRVTIRYRRCSYPGCGRRAQRCDLDHTIPYAQGGRTCECNLAPLCRRHHQAKQTQGWHLERAGDHALTWTLPHGRCYRAGPASYPAG